MYTRGMQIIQSLPNKTNLFSLIFERSKFCKFRSLEKVAKIIAGEKTKAQKFKKTVRKQNMDSRKSESLARWYLENMVSCSTS